MSKPDPKLVEIFEYHFNIDLTQDKYLRGRIELAHFFNDVIQKSINDFMSAQIESTHPKKGKSKPKKGKSNK